MRSKKPTVREDASGLLSDCVQAEAASAVWTRFEAAFATLPPRVAALLSDYFSGVTSKELSERHQLSEEEIRSCIDQGKRALIEQLRRNSAIRQ